MTAETTPRCGRCQRAAGAPSAPCPACPDWWDCEAYGPEGKTVGALCFLMPVIGVRMCDSHQTCREIMAFERVRIFERIQLLAESGNETGVYLAQHFTDPEQILNGAQADSAPVASCSCPQDPDGTIRHKQSVCTDPVVARLGWYADKPPRGFR